MLRHVLSLICIKSYNDHKFANIYQNVLKLSNLKKISNLNLPVS